jgi:DNA-binding MarR family transcriptional regulator
MKGAHLAVQRVARGMLKGFEGGLTPARFDLMNAVGRGMLQCALWKRLRVVRSVVSEMLKALEKLRWIRRIRAADSRTKWVMLTELGRRVFETAQSERVETGDVAVQIDSGLAAENPEVNMIDARTELLDVCTRLSWAFARKRWIFRALYMWRPEDYYFWLTWPGEIAGEVPFVSAESASDSCAAGSGGVPT